MKTHLNNLQTQARLNLPMLQRLSNTLADCLAAADPDTVWGDITVSLTDDAGILPTNREFFGKDRPTDVITFRYDPIPGEEPAVSGDLIVNVECALREGRSREGINFELALYIAHGFDHLSGADDNTPARRAAMRRTEMKWLKTCSAESEAAFTTPLIEN